MKLKRNVVKCLSCGSVIESKHRHDFVFCSCGSIFIDGGLDYVRRGGDPALMEDLCEWELSEGLEGFDDEN